MSTSARSSWTSWSNLLKRVRGATRSHISHYPPFVTWRAKLRSRPRRSYHHFHDNCGAPFWNKNSWTGSRRPASVGTVFSTSSCLSVVEFGSTESSARTYSGTKNPATVGVAARNTTENPADAEGRTDFPGREARKKTQSARMDVNEAQTTGAMGSEPAAPGSTSSEPRTFLQQWEDKWKQAHADGLRTGLHAVPLIAAGARLAANFATGVAHDVLHTVQPANQQNPPQQLRGENQEDAAVEATSTSSSALDALKNFREACLDKADQLESQALQKLQADLAKTDSGAAAGNRSAGVNRLPDFVSGDPAAESVFRIFETLPKFIGPMRDHRTPNQLYAAILHYIDLQKKFLRKGFEPETAPTYLDRMIRRMFLHAHEIESIEEGEREIGDIAAAPVVPNADAHKAPAARNIPQEAHAKSSSDMSKQQAAAIRSICEEQAEREQDLSPPFFPVPDLDLSGNPPDPAALYRQDQEMRHFLFRSMLYCNCLYKACLPSAPGDFRDSMQKLNTYLFEDISPLNKVEVVEPHTVFTSKPFVPAHAVLIDHVSKAVVVCVRGTLSVNDVLTDLISDAVAHSEVPKVEFAQKSEEVLVAPAAKQFKPNSRVDRQGEAGLHQAEQTHLSNNGVGGSSSGTTSSTSSSTSNGEFYVHEGMWASAQNISTALADPVLSLLKEHKNYKLVLTGHSLGAGTTSLLYAIWSRSPYFAHVNMFCAAHACPPVCTQNLRFTADMTDKEFWTTKNPEDVAAAAVPEAEVDATFLSPMSKPCQDEEAQSTLLPPRLSGLSFTSSGSSGIRTRGSHDQQHGQPARPLGTRFFTATVVGWDVVPRLSQASVLNLRKCVEHLCDIRQELSSSTTSKTNGGTTSGGGDRSSASVAASQTDEKDKNPSSRKRQQDLEFQFAIWKTLQAMKQSGNELVFDEETGTRRVIHQLYPPGEKVLFMVYDEDESSSSSSTPGAVATTPRGTRKCWHWHSPGWFDEIVLSSNMLKTHMPGSYAAAMKKLLSTRMNGDYPNT
ncbi:unnamed protein product [Amoebophrya sp. A120]|nr:unnamed protein product [Amoebophrya sp. A120]|eukprot:GSA120T00020169001.1